MQTDTPPLSHYQRIGGEEKIRALVKRFYQLMDTLPEAQGIRRMHEENLDEIEEVLFKFLTGWMGGPQLYIQERGHPMLRRRHLPFTIGDSERDQWMQCMNQALNEIVEDAGLRQELSAAFLKVADHMRNRAG